MRYLLDTNIVIAAMKGQSAVRARLERTPLDSLVLSPIVVGELGFGAEKSVHKERNRAHLLDLVGRLTLVVMDGEVAHHYGRLRAFLERQGTPIGSNDTWIAAHALAVGAVLVTDNMAEFTRVPGLTVENWFLPEP